MNKYVPFHLNIFTYTQLNSRISSFKDVGDT